MALRGKRDMEPSDRKTGVGGWRDVLTANDEVSQLLTKQREFLINICAPFFGVLGAVQFAIYQMLGFEAPIAARIASIGLIIILFASPLIYQRSRSFRPISIVLNLSIGLSVYIGAWTTSGLQSPSIVLLVSLPILVTFMTGIRAGLFTLVGVSAAMIILVVRSSLVPGVPQEDLNFGIMTSFLGIVASGVVFLLVCLIWHAVVATLRRLKVLEGVIRDREADTRGIIDISPYPMLVTRPPTGEVLYRNEKTMELFDVPGGRIGRFNVNEFLVNPEDIVEFREQVLEEGGADALMRFQTSTGREFRGELSARVVKFQGGPAINIIVKDVEHILVNEERLEEEKAKVQQQADELRTLTETLDGALEAAEKGRQIAELASQQKSAFLAVMSHEIRNPMNGVLGMIQVLKGQTLEAEQLELIGVIDDSGKTLLRIIDDILDYAKLETGKMLLEERAVEPEGVFKSIVDLLRPKAEEKGLKVELIAPSDTELPLLLDEHRLRQVLLNLGSNALKFTDEGVVKFSWSIENTCGDGLRLLCQVTDTGPGVSETVQKTLFTRYTQADRSISRRFGGTGLGLAICREIIELMGGEIGVKSPPGSGSTFWFDIPVTASAESSETVMSDHIDPETLFGRVLVAEDNNVNRMVIGAMLEKTNLTVQFANNGEEAILLLERGDFDAVLMDIQMPVMDGLEATILIRQMSSPAADIPVLALTANVMSSDKADCIAAGMDDVIEKPVLAVDLFRKLASALTPEQSGHTMSRRLQRLSR